MWQSAAAGASVRNAIVVWMLLNALKPTRGRQHPGSCSEHTTVPRQQHQQCSTACCQSSNRTTQHTYHVYVRP